VPRAWPVAGSRTLLPSTIESESQFQDEFESESAVVLEARRALLLHSELDPRAMASSDSTSTRSHCQRTRNNLNQRDSEPEASTIRRATRAVAAGSAVTSRDSDSTKFKPECNLKLKLKRRLSTGALSGRRTTTARGLPDRPGRAVTALGPGPPSPLTGSPALSGHYAGPGHGHGGPPTRTPSLSSWQLDSEPGAPARASADTGMHWQSDSDSHSHWQPPSQLELGVLTSSPSRTASGRVRVRSASASGARTSSGCHRLSSGGASLKDGTVGPKARAIAVSESIQAAAAAAAATASRAASTVGVGSNTSSSVQAEAKNAIFGPGGDSLSSSRPTARGSTSTQFDPASLSQSTVGILTPWSETSITASGNRRRNSDHSLSRTRSWKPALSVKRPAQPDVLLASDHGKLVRVGTLLILALTQPETGL
jgi:hypothetical protein